MAIKIEAKKVISRGIPMWKIINIRMLKYLQLPVGYIEGAEGGSMWLRAKTEEEKDRIVFKNIHGKIDQTFMVIGDLLNVQDFITKIMLIKVCGANLQNVNKQLAEKNKDWNGEETFTI